jgi:two-component system, LytTR family, sensor kinase
LFAVTKNQTTIASLSKNAWARFCFLFGAGTLFGLLIASQTYIAYNTREVPFQWSRILLLSFIYAYSWAALTPFILWLGRRFPLERFHWRKSLTIHFASSLLLSIATRALEILSYFFLVANLEQPLSVWRVLRNVLAIFDYGVLIYWVIILINYAFEYHRRFREGELKASQLEAQLAQAQLQALKMQLNPHFLFNTLNSITALMSKDQEGAEKMIARLGDFLRLTLENRGTQEVTLKEELDFLKCYLEIERIRFQDRLQVNINVEPDTLAARLPNLILQPIVENAIIHGIAPRRHPGCINIRARRLNGHLLVQVIDNGAGISSHRNLLREGIGLANTQARLEQLYGAEHRIDLENIAEGGLAVTLEIPFLK